MSWVTENKFLTGFGAVMLAGVGALGWFTYAAMDRSDTAMSEFNSASAQLKRLQNAKPGLVDANLKELVAQKTELAEKIAAFKKELKGRVLETKTISKVAFQDKLKDTVAQISARAAVANVEKPKDFYLGFDRYQSQPPDDKATSALDWELRAIEAVMNVLIKTGSIELEKFERDPLPEEGMKAGRQRASGEHGIERATVRLTITSKDDALRSVLTGLANHRQQLFVIRSVSVENKVQDSPPRLLAGPAPDAPAPVPAAAPDGSPAAPVPAAPAAPAAPPAPGVPAVPPPQEGPLSYIFGMEKITSVITVEILNFVEPKADSEKPEKGGKKKDK